MGKRVVFDPLKERGITVDMMVGNHDAYYKNTNDISAVDLLLEEYDNVTPYSETATVDLDGRKPSMFLGSTKTTNKSPTKPLTRQMPQLHLVTLSYVVSRSTTMLLWITVLTQRCLISLRKYSQDTFTRSNNGKVYYLGNPYEMFWSDVGDQRGFTIFDTDTLEFTRVNNPYSLFYSIYYEDTDYQMFDARNSKDKLVKVVIRKKTDQVKFEKFIDKIYSAGVADLKVIENFAFSNLDPHLMTEI